MGRTGRKRAGKIIVLVTEVKPKAFYSHVKYFFYLAFILYGLKSFYWIREKKSSLTTSPCTQRTRLTKPSSRKISYPRSCSPRQGWYLEASNLSATKWWWLSQTMFRKNLVITFRPLFRPAPLLIILLGSILLNAMCHQESIVFILCDVLGLWPTLVFIFNWFS